jgi:nitrogen fixation NifU-like protein
MAYSDKVIDHYNNPRNIGSLDKGKSINDALKIDNMDIVEELSLPPVKIHCSVLAEDAIKSAINDWRVKNGLDPIIDDKKRY